MAHPDKVEALASPPPTIRALDAVFVIVCFIFLFLNVFLYLPLFYASFLVPFFLLFCTIFEFLFSFSFFFLSFVCAYVRPHYDLGEGIFMLVGCSDILVPGGINVWVKTQANP